MMYFAVTMIDRPGAADLRAATAAAHREFVMANADRMLLGGPLTGADGAENIGSLIVLAAEDEAAARAILASEPYSRAGLFEQVVLRRFRPVIHNPALAEGEP